MKLSVAAKRVIVLARKVRKYYDAELPKWYPDYPIVNPGEKGPPSPREEGELKSFLQSLPEETIFRLLLIMLLGSCDLAPGNLPGSYEAMKKKYGTADWAIVHMMANPPLADYLSDGLSELERHEISVNDLPLEDTKKATA